MIGNTIRPLKELVEGWYRLTEPQQRRLSLIDRYAGRRDDRGLGFDLIAWDGDNPVVYMYDAERERTVLADGRIG